ncbi:MAG: hypothetical protein MZV63_64415 [Marinilabiliales bacterium]|nr:hypothetical protein [Marinilabiliales bacterium]
MHLQGHVLEGGRRPVPELEDVPSRVERPQRDDLGMIEGLRVVGPRHGLRQDRPGEVRQEGSQDLERGPAEGRSGIARGLRPPPPVRARGTLSGDVEPPVRGDAPQDGLGGRGRQRSRPGCSDSAWSSPSLRRHYSHPPPPCQGRRGRRPPPRG